MIEINIKCKSKEQQDLFGEKLCKALVGSPGYISNEIIVNYAIDDRDHSVYLVVGNDQACKENDVAFEIDEENIILTD